MAANNSGTSTLTADSCAGCHRAHTAQGAMLLTVDEEALCLTCHGSDGKGATTNVVDGVQYSSDNDGTWSVNEGPVAGALRGGGFVNARIDSTNPTRIPLPRWSTEGTSTDLTDDKYVASFSSRVPARATGAAVTSAHMKLAAGTNSGVGGTNVVLQGTAWGNGPAGSGVGPSPVALECASCHNPHGNGQYRILNPVPHADGVTLPAGVGVPEIREASTVTGARNYTVNTGASLATVSAGLGDYWRRYQPYDIVPIVRTDFDKTRAASSGTTCATNPVNGPAPAANCPVYYPAGYFAGDAPEFVAPGNPSTTAAGTWRTQISAWCSTCHTRYNTVTTPSAGGSSYSNPLVGDDVFMYRHPTTGSLECTKCHVAHGSNALMPGDPALGTAYSSNAPYPDAPGGAAAVTNASSRLLKVDNRGTCQQCHDPTGTINPPLTPSYP